MTVRLCPLTHLKNEQYEADTGNLCRYHAKRFKRACFEISDLFEELETSLIPSSTNAGNGSSGTPTYGLNLDDRVIMCRHDIRNVMSTWAKVIIEERSVSAPQDDLPSISQFMQMHIDWCMTRQWAHQLALDVISIWEYAKRLLHPNPVRSFEVGPCPDCDGVLIAYLRPQDSLLPHEVVCNKSPTEDGFLTHAWTADKWMTLGRKIRKIEG